MPFKHKKTQEQEKPFLAYPIPAPVFQTSGTSAGVLSYIIHKSARKYKAITQAEGQRPALFLFFITRVKISFVEATHRSPNSQLKLDFLRPGELYHCNVTNERSERCKPKTIDFTRF